MTVAQPLIELDASYARAVPRLSVPWTAAPAPAPELLLLNAELADELGLDAAALRAPAGVALLTGHGLPEGVATVAQAYAGHQFGIYQPRLGDGRALLLGEVVDRARPPARPAPEGVRAHTVRPRRRRQGRGGPDAARVPHRRGDARARDPDHAGRWPSSPPASRCRASSSCPARCSAGWPRATCGWARSSTPPPPATADVLRALADYAIARHHPDAADAENPYLALYRRVVDAQAELVARWMLVGFIHGVMNTDNMTISGETIDYGPCAFMDAYDPATVFSSIDERAATPTATRPRVAQWNLARLGEALLPLIDEDADAAVAAAVEAVNGFAAAFQGHWDEGMAAKLGLPAPDPKLVEDLAGLLRTQHVDFTSFFRALSAGTARDLFLDRDRVRRVGRPPRRAAARRPGGGGGGDGPGQPRLHPAQPPRGGGAHRGDRGRPGALPHAARRRRAAVHAASGAGGVRGPGRRHPVRHLLRHLTVSPAPGA